MRRMYSEEEIKKLIQENVPKLYQHYCSFTVTLNDEAENAVSMRILVLNSTKQKFTKNSLLEYIGEDEPIIITQIQGSNGNGDIIYYYTQTFLQSTILSGYNADAEQEVKLEFDFFNEDYTYSFFEDDVK